MEVIHKQALAVATKGAREKKDEFKGTNPIKMKNMTGMINEPHPFILMLWGINKYNNTLANTDTDIASNTKT